MAQGTRCFSNFAFLILRGMLNGELGVCRNGKLEASEQRRAAAAQAGQAPVCLRVNPLAVNLIAVNLLAVNLLAVDLLGGAYLWSCRGRDLLYRPAAPTSHDALRRWRCCAADSGLLLVCNHSEEGVLVATTWQQLLELARDVCEEAPSRCLVWQRHLHQTGRALCGVTLLECAGRVQWCRCRDVWCSDSERAVWCVLGSEFWRTHTRNGIRGYDIL